MRNTQSLRLIPFGFAFQKMKIDGTTAMLAPRLNPNKSKSFE
jgi:hypothetical protein